MKIQMSKDRDKKHVIGLIALALLLGILIGWFLGRGQVVSAQSATDGELMEKYYTSVYIEEGDTIWGIAKKYMTKEYRSIRSYVKEIKECNNLYSDDITAGCYLLVPYYATEPLEDTTDISNLKDY